MAGLYRSGGSRFLRTVKGSVKFAKEFAVGSCFVIKDFDKLKAGAMFELVSKGGLDGSDISVAKNNEFYLIYNFFI